MLVHTHYLVRMTQQTMSSLIPEFTVADRLRKAREVTGLDQTQFAAEIDVSRGTVSNYEQGRTNVRRIVLKAWALRSGVPIEWIETGAVGPQDDGGGAAERPRQGSNLRPSD